MRKSIIIFSLIFAVAVISLICLNLPSYEESFFSNNAALCLTLFFSAGIFIAIKDFSKQIAVTGAVLLVFIYSVFAWALAYDSAVFTRIAIVLTQTAIITFALFCGIITKNKTTEKIKHEVSRYVANPVIENLESLSSITAEGRKENLTIMFIDIRGFTTISENHSAEEVTEILNNYFREIIPVINNHNGSINKFIGDAILAVFQGVSPEVHAQNAVKAGKEILEKLKNMQIIQEAAGKEKITAGIGVNTGEVYVSCIGTEERCEYAVIGDNVNIASRTESANRIFKTEFLLTENTYPYVKDIADVIKISNVELKGKKENKCL